MLIIGLGNIGNEFERTYHNMGFMVIDKIAEKLNFNFSKNKCDAIVAEGFINNKKVILAKPTTFMNNSGISANELLKNNNFKPEEMLVICDDIDLPLGKIRYREQGSAGTHNGLKSIIANINTPLFKRLRMGVGKPNENQDLANFVLSKIDDEKFEILKNSINEGAEFVLAKLKEE